MTVRLCPEKGRWHQSIANGAIREIGIKSRYGVLCTHQIANHGGTRGELIVRLAESSSFGGPHADAAARRKASAG